MKRTVLLLFLTFICLIFASCGKGAEYFDNEYFLMDSVMTVRLSSDGANEEELTEISQKAMARVRDIENSISATVSDSDVSRFNLSTDGIDSAGEDFSNVLSVAMTVAKVTDGAYDPTLGALIDLWNISGGGPVPSSNSIADALNNTGYEKITAKESGASKSAEGLLLDFGGIGKGYAIQQAVELLDESDISYGLCSFGSTVGVFGQKPDGEKFTVTVCDPADTSKTVGEFTIESGYISSSGDYERYFELDGVRYHHIIDPKNGYPVRGGLHSVSVYSSNGQLSDALSTALFVMGVEDGLEFYSSGQLSFEAVFVTDDGIYLTDGLKSGDLFKVTSEKYKILN